METTPDRIAQLDLLRSNPKYRSSKPKRKLLSPPSLKKIFSDIKAFQTSPKSNLIRRIFPSDKVMEKSKAVLKDHNEVLFSLPSTQVTPKFNSQTSPVPQVFKSKSSQTFSAGFKSTSVQTYAVASRSSLSLTLTLILAISLLTLLYYLEEDTLS